MQRNAAGSLRVSLNSLFSIPQDWGIKGGLKEGIGMPSPVSPNYLLTVLESVE
jgi:hypothetical protein